MALQASYYDAILEVEVKDCYYKITRLEGDKNRIIISLGVFKSKEKADSNIVINELLYEFTPNLDSNDNFITQAYDFLKTLPNFKDATDV